MFHMEPMRRLLVVGLLVVVASFGGARAVAGDEPKDVGPFARGFGYVGAFYVTQSSTEVRLFSTDLPLGARLNVEKDLGVRDSFTVPRITLGWRFGKRHVLTGGYYDLSRDGVKRLERTIELPGDIEFPVGVEVVTALRIRAGCIIGTSGPPELLDPSPFTSHPLVNGTGSVRASSLLPVHRGVTAPPDPGRSGLQPDLVCGVVLPMLVKSTRL